jgi:hypothetical protein
MSDHPLVYLADRKMVGPERCGRVIHDHHGPGLTSA